MRRRKFIALASAELLARTAGAQPVVNLKSARLLDIAMPASILARADEVIE